VAEYNRNAKQAKHCGGRDYAIPTSLTLQAQTPYRISIWIEEKDKRNGFSNSRAGS